MFSKNKIRTMLMLTAMALLAFSCKKQETATENQFQDPSSPLSYTTSELPTSGARDGDGSSMMVIGNDKGIPFSLRNMRAAANFINANSNHGLIVVSPTHYYVQFNPTTNEHLTLLDSLCNTYALYNYPIQNVVLQEGSYISVSEETQNKFAPLYASIPIGDVLPAVPYTVIDTLFDPDEEQFDLAVVSYVLTGNADQLGIQYNGEDLTVSTLPEYLALPESTKGSGNYYPEGILKVQTSGNNYEPVKNTKLQIVRWGIPYAVFTDANGHFKLNKKMRGEVKVRATWRNGDYIIRKSWNEMLGIATSDAICYMNQGSSGPYKVIKIDNTNTHLWYKAIVSNALYKYNQHMESCGVTGIHNDANIWVMVSSNGMGGATPMAKKYTWAVTYNGLLSGWLQYFAPITYPIGTQFGLLFGHLYPDIVLSFSSSSQDVENIEDVLFHEAGHFSHGVKAGGSFWSEFVRREFENILNNSNHDPYQNGLIPSDASGQLIALCEGWADFVCNKCMNHYYDGNANSYKYKNQIEGFTMRTRPSQSPTMSGYMNCWLLTGLFWDIVDNEVDSQSKLINGQTLQIINYITDNLQIGSLSDLSPVYNCMTSTTLNGGSLKSKLLSAYQSNATQINQLFTTYGY